MAALGTTFITSQSKGFQPVPNPEETTPIPTPETPERATDVDSPQAKSAENAASVPTPTVETAQDAASIPSPVAETSQSAANVPTPTAETPQNAASVPVPTAEAPQSEAVAAAPSVITTSQSDAIAPPFPLNHARILYRNRLFEAQSITASSGTGASNTIKPNTFEAWSFTATSEIEFVFSSNLPVDTICIGGHNLGTDGATVTVEIDTNASDPVDVTASQSPTTDDALMFHFGTEYSAKRIIVTITAGTANAKNIAYISAGVALQMQRPFFSGHTPITDGDVTEYFHNRTQSGQIIGQAIRRQGYQTSCNWKNIDDAWYRTYFPAFKQSVKTLPFFMAWNLLEYPEDVGFCRVAQDISAPYSGVNSLRNIQFDILGV